MIRPYSPKDVPPYHPSVLDIETDPDGTVIGLGFAWDDGERRYRAFDGFDDWWEWFEPFVKTAPKPVRSRLLRIYAHNGAGFDWLSLVEWARNRSRILACKYVIADSIGIGCNIRLSTRFGSLRLRDSMRLMPGSLKSITSMFDIQHKKIDLDERLPHVIKADNEPLFWKYLEYDILGLQESIFAFWSMIYDKAGTVGELPMTLPSLAMVLWRKTLTEPILTPRESCLKELERKAYHGGRTECRKVGIENTVTFDINSQYPSVMLNGVFPVNYLGRWVDEYTGHHGVYEIEYEQTATDRLPVLYDPDQKRYAYAGHGYYYQPEIEKLIAVGGRVTRTIQGYEYVRMGNPFQSFIRFWWDLRLSAQLEGNEGLRYVAKILMNSLYGKLGQREIGWSMQVLTGARMRELMDQGIEFYDYGNFCMVQEAIRNEHVFVGMAGYVTSQARVLLYDYANTVPMDAVWYMDTDSVHVSEPYAESFISTVEIGGLKEEKRDEFAYAGKKLYYPKHGKLTAKGIGKSARLDITYETFCDMVRGTIPGIETEFDVFPTPKDVILHEKPAAVLYTRKRKLSVTAKDPP